MAVVHTVIVPLDTFLHENNLKGEQMLTFQSVSRFFSV